MPFSNNSQKLSRNPQSSNQSVSPFNHSSWLLPAEWEPHAATWIAWPHQQLDWREKLTSIRWTYAEMVRLLSENGEKIQILAHDESLASEARHCLVQSAIDPDNYQIHIVPNDHSWLRDVAPTAVRSKEGALAWCRWFFNGWARYENYHLDQKVPEYVSAISGLPLIDCMRPDNGFPLILEGGAIETDGQGTLLVTEECLLSTTQQRNEGLERANYEQAFSELLGIKHTIWLPRGIEGDDTHGHIDDVARFAAPGTVLLAYEDNPAHSNYESSKLNFELLDQATDAQGRRLEIIKLPFPQTVLFGSMILPATYANFYIANEAVLVPTFNDPRDYEALSILRDTFPKRRVIGINARDMVIGGGTLHCSTQQQLI